VSIFEQASKDKLRFPSIKGPLTVENLWDLPLESKTGFDLDSVAKSVNQLLKSVTEESFVKSSSNPEKAQHELSLAIVKHVIAVKQAENESKRTSAAKAAEKAQLVEILANKQAASLHNLSEEEIRKRIDSLSS